MPGEDHLPPGPQRDLTIAVHALYEGAGMPGTRIISDAIRRRNDLNDTVSHEAVRGILLGTRSRWAKVSCVTSQLVAWSVRGIDPGPSLEEIHGLWLAAEKAARGTESDPSAQVVDEQDLSLGGQGSGTSDTPDSREQPHAQKLEIRRGEPLIRWDPRLGTLEIFDRQMAMQIITDMGNTDA